MKRIKKWLEARKKRKKDEFAAFFFKLQSRRVKEIIDQIPLNIEDVFFEEESINN